MVQKYAKCRPKCYIRTNQKRAGCSTQNQILGQKLEMVQNIEMGTIKQEPHCFRQWVVHNDKDVSI